MISLMNRSIILTDRDKDKAQLQDAIIIFVATVVVVGFYILLGFKGKITIIIAGALFAVLFLLFSLFNYFKNKGDREQKILIINENGITLGEEKQFKWEQIETVFLSRAIGKDKNNSQRLELYLYILGKDSLLTGFSFYGFYGRFNPYELRDCLFYYMKNRDNVQIRVRLWMYYVPRILDLFQNKR